MDSSPAQTTFQTDGTMNEDFKGLRRWTGLHGVEPDSVHLPDVPPGWQGLVAVTRTPEESSVIGPWRGTGLGPYRGWSVIGPLAPDLVGVLAAYLEPLRAAGIPVLAFSTHDTDWMFVDEARSGAAEAAWRAAGVPITDASGGSGEPL